MHPWHDLEPGTPDRLLAYIEIGAGQRTKYEVHKPSGLLRLDRILHGSLHYPINYGIIPRTLGPDQDPLDILVHASESLQPGTFVFARLVGVLHMLDGDEKDDKLLALPLKDPATAHFQTPQDFPTSFWEELQHFFQTYTDLEDKHVTTPGYNDRPTAERILREAQERYNARFVKN